MLLCLLAQLCLTFCDPMDYSPPGSSVHGDSPGKNIGVGCHALQSSPPRDWTQVSRIAGRFFTSWAMKEAQEYWSGQACPFSRIFPTQGLNPSVPHSWRILYQLSHKRSPRILEWAACPFSSGLSRPRNWTGFSCIAARPTELCGKPIPQVNSCFALCRVSVRTVLNFNR